MTLPARPVIARSLRHRNYRLFVTGQSVSLIGTWITRVATSWLVYRLTGSEFLLGLTGFMGQIPMLVLSPLTGVLVDRWDRHRMLVITQIASLLQSATLAVLALTGVITVVHVLILQLCQGMINAFDTPARQSFLIDMVQGREDLPNAIAINSSMVNGSRIIGPAIAGLLVSAFGEGWCFLVDAISYVAVIISLLTMQATWGARVPAERHLLRELRDGFHYVHRSVPIRSALLLLAIVSMMGMPYSVLMPAIAAGVLHGGAHALGFLMTASGVGALAGGLYLASRGSIAGLGRIIAGATAVFGFGLIAFSLSHAFWLSMLILPFVGLGFMVQLASTNTVIQSIVEEQMRGRTMAFYAMAVLGTAPLGSIAAGALAARIGAPMTILIGGVVCVGCALWFTTRIPTLQPQAQPSVVQDVELAALAERTDTKGG
jgi:MFS family permease